MNGKKIQTALNGMSVDDRIVWLDRATKEAPELVLAAAIKQFGLPERIEEQANGRTLVVFEMLWPEDGIPITRKTVTSALILELARMVRCP